MKANSISLPVAGVASRRLPVGMTMGSFAAEGRFVQRSLRIMVREEMKERTE
jgi:hypothetical protein